MYVSVRRYEGVKKTAEVGERVRKEFVPLISGIDGFVAYYWVDAGGGVVISTSIFENKAAAEKSNRLGIDWAKTNLADVSPNPPQITEGNVIAEAHGEELPTGRRGAGREAEPLRH